MEYIFGNIKRRGKLVHVLKTIGEEHSNLIGANQIERKYPDSIILDEFVVKEKYLSKRDAEGHCYDWYIITDHYRYIDYFTPLKEQITEGIEDSQVATCDLSEELDERITDVEVAICELSETLEGGE